MYAHNPVDGRSDVCEGKHGLVGGISRYCYGGDSIKWMIYFRKQEAMDTVIHCMKYHHVNVVWKVRSLDVEMLVELGDGDVISLSPCSKRS